MTLDDDLQHISRLLAFPLSTLSGPGDGAGSFTLVSEAGTTQVDQAVISRLVDSGLVDKDPRSTKSTLYLKLSASGEVEFATPGAWFVKGEIVPPERG